MTKNRPCVPSDKVICTCASDSDTGVTTSWRCLNWFWSAWRIAVASIGVRGEMFFMSSAISCDGPAAPAIFSASACTASLHAGGNWLDCGADDCARDGWATPANTAKRCTVEIERNSRRDGRMDFREWLGLFAICHLSTHADFKSRMGRAQRARLNSN